MPLADLLRRWCPRISTTAATLCAVLGVGWHQTASTGHATEPPMVPRDAQHEIQLVEYRTTSSRDEGAERILEEKTRLLEKGSSSQSARQAATSLLPLGKMSQTSRRRAETILASTSLFRELPVVETVVEPDVYQFFVAHPDVAASIWRVMKISKFELWQTGENEYEADAGDGTVGVVDALYRSPEQNVILCEGTFTSPLLTKPIKASALFHLRTHYVKTADGRYAARSALSMFVAFPSQAVEAAARLVSPVSNVIVDRNFREVCLFVHMMGVAMERQPGWVEQVAGKMQGVLDIRRQQLLDVTAKTYVAARERELTEASQMPPLRR